jgi:pimeloyl-ACP methyl ester carboxylesterase
MTNSKEQIKRYISHKDLKLSYRVYGDGEIAVLCLHGHGRSSSDFEFLSCKGRKIISIDLFLHGDSKFDKSRIYKNLITTDDVEKLLEKLLKKEKIKNFHWVAYSQGGRFTLTLYPRFKNKVLSLNLLAPDGLNDKNFYSWSQRRWWARSLFKRWVRRPNELMTITKSLAKAKVIRPKIVDFLNYYTSEPERLKLAHATWRGFRKLRPSNQDIKNALEETDIHFQLIIGKYDQIITVDSATGFLTALNKESALKVLPYGHDLFKPEIEKKLFELMNFESF